MASIEMPALAKRRASDQQNERQSSPENGRSSSAPTVATRATHRSASSQSPRWTFPGLPFSHVLAAHCDVRDYFGELSLSQIAAPFQSSALFDAHRQRQADKALDSVFQGIPPATIPFDVIRVSLEGQMLMFSSA